MMGKGTIMRMEQDNGSDTKQQIREIAEQIMRLAHDGLLMNLRFLDAALAKLSVVCREGTGAHLFDGACLYYDPALLVRQYKDARGCGARLLLHTLLHCVFSHGFGARQMERHYWDLATDIAVESVILELSLPLAKMPQEDELKSRLEILKKQAGGLTAEKLYRHFRIEEPSDKAKKDWYRLCHYDEHIYWDRQEELVPSAEQWKKLSERIRADLKSFSRDKNNAESMEENLRETLRERYDYTDFLKRFMVMGESVRISEDEFDYIYYTYGLTNYGNMPLVEPLEYKEDKRIRDFVIALDTSASCRGEIVQTFLQKTYNIMRQQESFFTKINVHILQCDSEVRQDTKITGQEDFDAFLEQGKLTGFGSTDFRPVFDYVEKLRDEGEFSDLKGLIYFTDGYGVYPEYLPDYDAAFVFLRHDDNAPKVPPWAIKVVLEEDEIESFEEET